MYRFIANRRLRLRITESNRRYSRNISARIPLRSTDQQLQDWQCPAELLRKSLSLHCIVALWTGCEARWESMATVVAIVGYFEREDVRKQ